MALPPRAVIEIGQLIDDLRQEGEQIAADVGNSGGLIYPKRYHEITGEIRGLGRALEICNDSNAELQHG